MKTVILLFLSIFLLSSSLYSKDNLSPKAKEVIKKKLLNANTMGKYFVIAFDPNETSINYPKQVLAVYIAASEQTTVRMHSPSGFDRSYNVPAMGVVTVSTGDDLNWQMENRIEDKVSQNGFILEGDKPFSVYVLNSKSATSDGYMAMPVNAWGYEYIHCSYWDFKEAGSYKTGFVVLAAEDKTKITINLKGRGEEFKTLSGRSLNTVITKTLNKGEIYMIQGKGETRGAFDMSGTIIKGDKPIAILSSHERVMIPPFVVTNGRNHLSSMPLPVTAWGKNYVTVELNRQTDKGDYFRVVAGADNVTFEVRWYDKKTGAYLGFWDGILAKKGDWDDFNKVSAEMPHSNESIRGISYFKADKPIYVAQYSYSANWDLPPINDYDPFMFGVSAVEQFTKSTIFQTPSNSSGGNEFMANYLNLVIYADASTEEERMELIRTLKMDGKLVSASNPEVFGQKFPALGTKYDDKLYWVTLDPAIGPHTLEGDVAFGGYVYGFSSFDSYGWRAATAYRNLGEVDTLPPVLTILDDCGLYQVNATELRNFKAPDDCDTCKPQVDQGIIALPTIVDSANFKAPIIDYAKEPDKAPPAQWFGLPFDFDFNFIFEVVDKKKDGFVHFIQGDRTGENFTDTTIFYYADNLKLDKDLNYGLKRLYTTNEIKVNLISDKDFETKISEIKFKNMLGNFYTVTAPSGTLSIPPRGQIELTLQYKPTREYLDAETYTDGQYDLDSLIIVTECVEFAFPVKGQGGEPYMYVSDWNNGTVPINTALESNPGTSQNLYVQNYNRDKKRNATFPLEVYGIEVPNVTDENVTNKPLAPYTTGIDLALNVSNDFPVKYTLTHTDGDARVSLNKAYINSATTGLFERNVPFKTNAVNYLIPGGDNGDDTLSNWKTRVVSSDATISNELWNKERELRTADNSIKATINSGKIIIQNTSTSVVQVNNITLKSIYLNSGATGNARFTSPGGNFKIDLDPTVPYIKRLVDGTGNEKLVPVGATGNNTFEIPILFTPQNPYSATSHIINEQITAVVSNNGEDTELVGNLTGEVYLPILEAIGDTNTSAVLINTQAPYTLTVTIKNVGYNGDLYVWNIANPDNSEFTYVAGSAVDNTGTAVSLPTNAAPWIIPVNATYTLSYNFTPTSVGIRKANVLITHSGDIKEHEPVEESSYRQTGTAYLQAPGRSTGFYSTPLSFGPVLKCDDLNDIISVTNDGTDPITITRISLNDGTDLNNVPEFDFTYKGGNINTFVGVVIPANTTETFDVKFIPSQMPQGTFTTTRVVEIQGSYNATENPVTSSTINGLAQENIVKFSVNDNNGTKDLTPDLAITDGGFNLGIGVTLDTKTANNGWDEANITTMTFKFKYKLNWIQPTKDANGNYILKGQNGWTFNITNRELDATNEEWEILTFTGNGPDIKNDGVILYPFFNVKLPSLATDSLSLEKIEPELYDVSFGSRDLCIYNEPDKGYIDVQACAAAFRTLPIQTGQFVNNIQQTATSVNFNYAVPFESDVQLEVIDMSGNVVSMPVSGKIGRGFYNANVPLSQLSSGAHIIRYTAGPLIKIDKIIIVK